MASTIACPVVIKVQISSKMKSKAPAVAARLQARDFPSRTPTPPEATARKELVIAQEKARKAALAAAHNMRVQNRHATIAQMQEATSVYLRETIDRRLQNSEARRANALDTVKSKAQKESEKLNKAHQTLEDRKASLAAAIDHSLEAAHMKRTQQVRQVQFKAANVVQKHKAVITEAQKSATDLAARIADNLHRAAEKRERILSARAERAAALNAQHESTVQRMRSVQANSAKQMASELESKIKAAEYLHDLNLKLRQSKASLANEHVALVHSRRKLSEAVTPMIANGKIRAELYLHANRRNEHLTQVSEKASKFVSRAVHTVAQEQMRAAAAADALRVSMQQRLADASARKEDAMHDRSATGSALSLKRSLRFEPKREKSLRFGPITPRAAGARAPRDAFNNGRVSPEEAQRAGEELELLVGDENAFMMLSAPSSPVCGAPAC